MKQNKDPNKLRIDDLKAVITFKKRKGDAPLPNKKEGLVEQYQKIHECSDLQLNKWLSKNNKKIETINKEDELIWLMQCDGKTASLYTLLLRLHL